MHTLGFITNLFPLWVLLASLMSLSRPQWFTWFSGPLIPVGLAIIMLGMGLTLEFGDIRRVARRPGRLVCGFVLQYSIMPFLGWSLAALFRLPTPFAVGLILVASCPGGTASNVITYLARGDVALSVAMTAASTLFAVVLTPALTAFLAASRVDVPAWGLFRDTLAIVLLPVAIGLALRQWMPALTRRLLPAAPLTAVVFITLIVASIIGEGREQIAEAGASLLAAIVALHAGGFLLGYLAARVWTGDARSARTISIEVGMQNSGLGASLARGNFGPLTAIPCAISSLCHSLLGSLFAAYCRARPLPEVVESEPSSPSGGGQPPEVPASGGEVVTPSGPGGS